MRERELYDPLQYQTLDVATIKMRQRRRREVAGETWQDHKSRSLLILLHQYQQEFSPDLPQTIPALAEDLAQSMDITSDDDDRMYREIAEAWYGTNI